MNESLSVRIQDYLERLFPICRSITGEGNRKTLKIISELIPIEILEVPSGTKVYDWVVPLEWKIEDAWIKDSKGEKVVDFKNSNLHVASYSEPVEGVFDKKTLEEKLVTHPTIPDAIPYRTLYYNSDWAFCLSSDQYESLKAEENYSVLIDSKKFEGSMTLGEYVIKGQSSEEILISCYICHPSMANDSLSGVILAAFLAEYLSKKDNFYTYRFVFVPETIGAIAYCNIREEELKKVNTGLVITTVGGPGPFGYKQSFNKDHFINAMIEQVFVESGLEFETYPFDIHGSDERQYSSQGFRINCATISKDKYYEYPFYHSSLDNLEFVNGNQLSDTLSLYKKLIDKIECNRYYRNSYPNCEVMLSKHDLYPKKGGAIDPNKLGGKSELDIILWILFLCDGKMSLWDVSEKIGASIDEVDFVAKKLLEKKILNEVLN